LCATAERDGDRGLRPGGLLHHATQQNARQAAEELLGHDAEAEGLFSLRTALYFNFNKTRYDEAAVASAELSHLHLAADSWPCQHSVTQFFTGPMIFTMSGQQCQSTEGKLS